MNLRSWFATTIRILRQLLRDRRTIGIVLVIPVVILTLLHYLFDERQPMVSTIEAQMLVVFPITIMFLLTAIAMVRERISGTLERLMTTPIGKADILFAYATAFGVLATLQSAVASTFGSLVLGMQVTGPLWQLFLTAIVSAQLGVALGLLASAISRSEFQAVQMFPVLVIPQLLLCGLFGPREAMADWLETISGWLPMTYGVEAMQET
ncbi:MAG: ABC transporter permease, partial [Propionibacteriaceae bacterium]|nr:ABC transporter permease [Propionibacteriaceae bacterium]